MKKSKTRKILCLLLSFAMAFALVGCISEDEGDTTSTNEADRVETTANDGDTVAVDLTQIDDEELVLLLEDEGLEIVDGKFRFKDTRNISVEIFDRGLDAGRVDPAESYWTKWIQNQVMEDHNIAVEFQTVPRWTEAQEVTNLLAARSAPDILYTYNYTAIKTYAEDMNGIIDMAPFIDELAPILPNLWGLLGEELLYFNKDPHTGSIWAIEGIRFTNTRINTFVREDWLAKLGLEPPTNLEEFEAMLYEFQANAELLLGSDADKMIPFTLGVDIGWRADHLLSSYVPHAITDKELYVLGYDDRRFLFPGIKEGVRVLNKWYNDGLIWQDFPLYEIQDSTEEDNMKAGYVGSMIHNWNFPYRDNEQGIQGMMQVAQGPEAAFIPVAVFQDDAGYYKKFLPFINDRKIAMPMTNEEPVASLIYLDFISRQDVRSYLGSGEEGITFEMLDDGTVRSLDPTREEVRDNVFTADFATDSGKTEWTYGEMIMNSPNNIDYLLTFNSEGIYYRDDDISRASLKNSYPTTSPEVIEAAVVLTALDGRLTKPVNVGNIESENGMEPMLPEKRNAVLANSVTTSPDNFDATFDSGMQDYLNSGGQAIIDERTEKWEAFYGDIENLDDLD